MKKVAVMILGLCLRVERGEELTDERADETGSCLGLEELEAGNGKGGWKV